MVLLFGSYGGAHILGSDWLTVAALLLAVTLVAAVVRPRQASPCGRLHGEDLAGRNLRAVASLCQASARRRGMKAKRKLLVKLQGLALTHRPSEGSSLLARVRFEAYG